jgi:hypothetical protein
MVHGAILTLKRGRFGAPDSSPDLMQIMPNAVFICEDLCAAELKPRVT